MWAIMNELTLVPTGAKGNSIVEKGTKCINMEFAWGHEVLHVFMRCYAYLMNTI